MDIQCFACTPPTKWSTEKEYKDHLVTVHGTSSPDEAIKLEKVKKANSPKLPLGIPPEAIPTKEFADMMKMVEKGPAPLTPPPPPPPFVAVTEPIVLKYKYEGKDTCGNDVKTFELNADGKHFAVAYCLFCQKQIESREVEDLGSKKETPEKTHENAERLKNEIRQKREEKNG